MTGELTVYRQVSDPLAFAMTFGSEIAKSKLFGCENESQGRVLAFACLAEGKNPIEIARQYHIIDGNLSMRADAMLAEFRTRGGRHKVLSRTAEKAEVQLTIGDEEYTESLTWDDARKEPYPFARGGETLKHNWATPRARRQMLWARVISEAVRTLRPEIVAGSYTPEEIHDFESDRRPVQSKPVDPQQLAQSVQDQDNEVIDPEYTIDQNGGSATNDQKAELRFLLDALSITNQQLDVILQKRHVQTIAQLTAEQVTELIGKLRDKLGGESRLPPDTISSDVTGPVSQVTVEQCKALMAGDPNLVKQVKDHLVKHGKAKIADLSHQDGELLKNCLESRLMDSFFGRVLEDAVPFATTTGS